MKRKRLRTALAVQFVSGILIVFSSCTEDIEPPATNPYNARLQFEQLDFTVEGMARKDSPWGSVVLNLMQPGEFPGSGPLFNLAVNSRWVIQNVPVLFDPQGGGKIISYTYYFDLDVPYGTDVTELEYAFDLTPDVRATMPDDLRKGSVADRSFIMSSGVKGEKLVIGSPPEVEKGAMTEYWGHLGVDFPNQDCGPMECVPAAVSNSLHFLNAKFNLGMPESQMDIISMKQATGWDNGCTGDWPEKKGEWTGTHNYPITTRTETDLFKILDEMKRGQDIEARSTRHCAVLVAIGRMANGKWVLYVAHDTKQGVEGGSSIDKVIYDPTTGQYEGAPGFHGLPPRPFVIECPK
ncbi:MAG: hypothetical protein JSU81_02475 [Candidatus Coatesbacteria bacterium]|nr:MAG: hypothetical protein JSU81_02475 [Candidatus Coatesbacteria bacterium]